MVQLNGQWLAGASLGLCALFRHDMSIYAGVAEIVVLALFTIADRRARLIQARCLPVLLGALIVVLPALALFAVTTPARELLQQLMIFPFIEFPKVFDLPYPGYAGRT